MVFMFVIKLSLQQYGVDNMVLYKMYMKIYTSCWCEIVNIHFFLCICMHNTKMQHKNILKKEKPNVIVLCISKINKSVLILYAYIIYILMSKFLFCVMKVSYCGSLMERYTDIVILSTLYMISTNISLARDGNTVARLLVELYTCVCLRQSLIVMFVFLLSLLERYIVVILFIVYFKI
jgi:hypothetical protein